MVSETVRWCAENTKYLQKFTGSNGSIYTVTCNKENAGKHVVNWNCTCKGWQYTGRCKHQQIAMRRRCTYGNTFIVGHAVEMGDTCPRCGGPTETVREVT